MFHFTLGMKYSALDGLTGSCITIEGLIPPQTIAECRMAPIFWCNVGPNLY